MKKNKSKIFLYYFTKKFFGQTISSVLILIMLGIALSLPLSLYLSVVSANLILKNIAINPQITVYIDLSADKVDIAALHQELKKFNQIKQISFIDKDTALQELVKNIGQEKFLSILNFNPLPNTFIITPNTNNPDEINLLRIKLNNLTMVDSAQIDAKWVQVLYNINIFLWKILFFLAITLSIAFILVTYNTIRLQIVSKQDEIEVSRLLGASVSYIVKPFLFNSVAQGLIAYVIAILFSSLIIYKASKLALDILNDYGISIHFRWFTIYELILILILILLLAIIGSFKAVKNHLLEFKQKYQ